MPAKNILKLYVENGYYHIYNRGVEKRIIFQDEQDYRVLLYFLKLYLLPPNALKAEKGYSFAKNNRRRSLNNFHQKITLLAYSLIPNHFHFLLKQEPANGIEKFMRSLGTKYVQYFNKRYQRVGPLFQDTYKAVLVETDEQLLHLSRYIHLNPAEHSDKEYPLQKVLPESYSSYADYLGKRQTKWVHPEEVLSFFKTAQRTSLEDLLSYQSFVENYQRPSEEIIEDLALE